MWVNIIMIIVSYILGCINTGYYYVLLLYRKDIRTEGTNVTGAYNVSKIAGKKGFVITFLGDAFKGALVVLLCRIFRLEETTIFVCILLVLLGHIFPIQLKFRGGKGLSTAFGAFLAFHPLLILYWLITSIVLLPFVKRYTVTCLFALALLPFELFISNYSWRWIGFILGYALVILFACRSNLKEYVRDRAYQGHR